MNQQTHHQPAPGPRVELLNPLGENGRDCPCCYRVGSLTGTRMEGLELSCHNGCGTTFLYRSKGLLFPQLERLFLADFGPTRCTVCGTIHGNRSTGLCSTCERS
jgi:hypothetical protein